MTCCLIYVQVCSAVKKAVLRIFCSGNFLNPSIFYTEDKATLLAKIIVIMV